MTLRAWLQFFVTAGALAWNVEVVGVTAAQAQQPTPPAATATDAPPTATPGQVPRLPDVDVVAEPPTQPSVNLQPNFEPFTGETIAAENAFSSPPFAGYHAGSSSAGSLLNVPDIRFPGTVSVVGKDLIRDQQALRMNDILRDIGGAVQTNDDQLRSDSFLLRGLELDSYNFRKNGFQDPTYTPRDFANVERVDVFKGPAAMLYGPAQPAGTVNFITKKAQQDRFAFGGVTFGSYGLQRYTADVNTMNQAGDILFRVNTAYENRSGFRDNYDNNRVFLSPTVTFLLSDRTALTWEGEFLQDHRRFDSGLVAVNGDTQFFPEDRYFGTRDDFQHFRDYRSTLSLVHQISDDWQFYLGGSNLFYEAPSQVTVPTDFFGFPPAGSFYTGGLLNREQSGTPQFAEQNHAIITNLSGVFDTGPLTHHAVVGFEGNWQVAGGELFNFSVPGLDPALTIDPQLSSYNGAYPGGTVSQSFSLSVPAYRQTRFGFYQQDLIDVGERWKILLSQRFDTSRTVYDRSSLAFGFPIPGFSFYTDDTINRWSPRAGLVYEWVPGAVSSYAVYTSSFNPPTGGNSGTDPELGKIWEGGFKVNIFEDLTATFGGFYIERQNASVLVSQAPLTFDQSGRQRSQGFEFNLTGNWTERLSTVSNYTYNDVVQTGYQNSTFGNSNGRVLGVPFNLANSWTRYNFIQDRDKTVGLGLGWVYVGDRRGDYNSPLVLSSYNRWDLGVFSQYRGLFLDAYVENIFNVRYETGSLSQYQVYPGAPANFRFQIGATF